MEIRAALLAGILFFVSSNAFGQKVSPQGCAYIADVGVTSRALSKNGISKEEARKILADMYRSEEKFVVELRARILEKAFNSDVSPTDFQNRLMQDCLNSQGDVNQTLGVAI